VLDVHDLTQPDHTKQRVAQISSPTFHAEWDILGLAHPRPHPSAG
jgi:hypothetical protein